MAIYCDLAHFRTLVKGNIMAKKIKYQNNPETGVSETEQRAAVAAPAKDLKAFEQMLQLGYPRYTFAMRFEQMDLKTDSRPYPVAKKVEVMSIKEDTGEAPYVGLGFVGILDEKLFLIVMEKQLASASIEKIKNLQGYVGLEFFGVSGRFGSVGTVALPKEAYIKFAEAISK